MTAFLKNRIALLVGVAIASCASAGANVNSDPVVGRINNEPVTAAEYRLVMLREAPNVYSHLKAALDLDDHSGYWREGGEPLIQLRETVQAKLVRIKVYQELARQKGLVKETGFGIFAEEHAAENTRRAEAVARGEVIYGPRSYSAAALYYVRFGELTFRLTDVLSKEAELVITEEAVEQVYKDRRSEFGEKSLESVRGPIRAYLAKERAKEQLEALCASAKVEMDAPGLRDLVPRVDALPDAARGRE